MQIILIPLITSVKYYCPSKKGRTTAVKQCIFTVIVLDVNGALC